MARNRNGGGGNGGGGGGSVGAGEPSAAGAGDETVSVEPPVEVDHQAGAEDASTTPPTTPPTPTHPTPPTASDADAAGAGGAAGAEPAPSAPVATVAPVARPPMTPAERDEQIRNNRAAAKADQERRAALSAKAALEHAAERQKTIAKELKAINTELAAIGNPTATREAATRTIADLMAEKAAFEKDWTIRHKAARETHRVAFIETQTTLETHRVLTGQKAQLEAELAAIAPSA